MTSEKQIADIVKDEQQIRDECQRCFGPMITRLFEPKPKQKQERAANGNYAVRQEKD